MDVQIRSRGCLLLYTYPSEFTKELVFRVGGFSLSVLLPLIRVILNLIGVNKTTESSNSLVKKTKSETDYLSRWYCTAGSDREGHINFSITTFRSRTYCEKSVLFPIKIIELLGIVINSMKMEFSLWEEKVQKFFRKLDQKLVSVRKVSQLIGTLSSPSLAVLPAPLQYRYLQI